MCACGIWRYALTCVAAIKPSPTMPTLIVGCCAMLNWKFADEFSSSFDVRDALIACLALNAAESGEAKLIQRIEEFLPIHFALSDRNFLAPLSRFFGAICVLEMHLPQPFPERAQRIHRITTIIENHICRIKIHTHVRAIQLNQE